MITVLSQHCSTNSAVTTCAIFSCVVRLYNIHNTGTGPLVYKILPLRLQFYKTQEPLVVCSLKMQH